MTNMRYYLFRRGDGNDGNFPRFIVRLSASKMSVAQRERFNAELEASTEEVLERTVEAAKEAGLSLEAVSFMKTHFLGVRDQMLKQPGREA